MRIGADRIVPDSPCTSCGHVMNRCFSVDADAAPSPGDFTLCIRCGHLMAFADDLALRDLTDAEVREVAGDRRALAVQAARAAYAKSVGGND